MRDAFVAGICVGVALSFLICTLVFSLVMMRAEMRVRRVDRRVARERHPSTFRPGADGHVRVLDSLDIPL